MERVIMQSKNSALGFLGIIFIVIGLLAWAIRMEMTAISVAPLVLGGILVLIYVFVNIGFLVEKLTGRAAIAGLNMAISITIFLAIAVFLEMILVKNSTRFDLTEAKKYSLASKSIQVAEGLTEPIHLQYLVNPSMPGATMEANDLMELYKRYSKHITTETIDPQEEPEKVQALGAVSVNTLYVRKGEKGEQHEKVSPITENDLTNAILKIVGGRDRVVYFTTGHKERPLEGTDNRDGLAGMKMVLEEDGYEAKELQLFTQQSVPEDAVAVVIAGPQSPFLEAELTSLKNYLTYGGKVLALIDPETESGLEKFLEENYGVLLGSNWILENNPLMQMFGGSPVAPAVSTYESHPIVDAFKGAATAVPFNIARSVNKADELPEGVEIVEFAKTSENSWKETDIQGIKTTGRAGFDEGVDEMGPVSIAIALSKPAEERISDATDTEKTEDESSVSEETDPNVEELDQEPEIRLVVFGDSDFATNAYYRNSMDLFMNSINWLAQQEDLISIRPKDHSGQPITVNPVEANFLMYSSMIILPGIMLILGIVVGVRRRMRG